jgi:hypothetical protein
LLLFVSGGLLCLSCCLIFPLPETVLYDLPDSLRDLKSMKRSTSSENGDNISPLSQRHHVIDSNTLAFTNDLRSNAIITSDFNDLSSTTPKAILRSQQQQVATGGGGKTVTIHSQPDIIQLQSNTSSFNALSNPCYFASLNDTIDQYDIEQQIDNRVVISIRGAQNNNNNNNNNNNSGNREAEATKF